METSSASTGRGLPSHLVVQPVRDHTLLHPWQDEHHEPNQKSQQGSGERQEVKREVEQVQRDKEEEMEADISLSRNYLSWTLSSPP